ncbi:hypothetical protein F5Y15DRAFT_33832 [Xylariaceae sp. FL0016]|nr:hypothetical protein F5Y15DRAFT_33832 [Xylariaceae sp. FL0016]
METTINAAVHAMDVDMQFGFDVACPTESCDFPEFESLGYCHSCEDLTDAVIMDGCNFTITWDHWRDGWEGPAEFNRTINNPCTVEFNMSTYGYTYDYQKTFDVGLTLDSVNKEYYEGVEDSLGIRKGGWDIWEPSAISYPSQLTWIVNRAKTWSLDGPNYDVDLFGEDGTLMRRKGERMRWNSLFPDTEAALVTVGHVKLGYDPDKNINGLSVQSTNVCSLNPCVQRFSLSAKNSTISTNMTSIRGGSYNIFSAGIYAWTEGTEKYTETNVSSAFHYELANNGYSERGFGPGEGPSSDPIMLAIQKQIEGQSTSVDSLQSTYFAMTGEATNYTTLANYSDANLCAIRPLTNQSEIDRTTQASSTNYAVIDERGGLEWVMPRIAKALSRSMRHRADQNITGQAYGTQGYIHVRWEWLSIPIVLVSLGTVFLLVTICLSRAPGEYIWKNSSLPLLFVAPHWHEFESGEGHDLVAAGMMEKKAKGTRASLAVTEGTGGLRFRPWELKEEEYGTCRSGVGSSGYTASPRGRTV